MIIVKKNTKNVSVQGIFIIQRSIKSITDNVINLIISPCYVIITWKVNGTVNYSQVLGLQEACGREGLLGNIILYPGDISGCIYCPHCLLVAV